MNMADRIQYLRKTKGISQESLADIIGVSRQAVSKWESEQSTPELDKIITISEYFDVTTDYILKGIEPVTSSNAVGSELTSKILYIGSTALIGIGLFCAFGSWYEDQSADSIWGSMIIQVVGAAGYFIGRLFSKAKAPFIVRWLNIVIAIFMPLSLVIAVCLNRIISPYPTDIVSSCIFSIGYIIISGIAFIILKRFK